MLAKPFVHVTWAKGIDPDGRPIVSDDPLLIGSERHVCPGLFGGANCPSPSYSPETGLFYFTRRDECLIHLPKAGQYTAGELFWGGDSESITPDDRARGALVALDPLTGQQKWEFPHFSESWAGVLTTQGGLAFSGNDEGYFVALDAGSGKVLWEECPRRAHHRVSDYLLRSGETVRGRGFPFRSLRILDSMIRSPQGKSVYAIATMDTKGEELAYVAGCVIGGRVRLNGRCRQCPRQLCCRIFPASRWRGFIGKGKMRC